MTRKILLVAALTVWASAASAAPAPVSNRVDGAAQCILEKDPAKADELFFEMLIRDEPQGVHFAKDHPCLQGPFAALVAKDSSFLYEAGMAASLMRLDAIGDCLAKFLTTKAKAELGHIAGDWVDRSPPVANSPEKFRSLVGTGASVCSPTLFDAAAQKSWLRSRLMHRMIESMPHA